MGVKIDRAILKKNTSETITAQKYTKSEHGDVLCPDRRCLCPLSHVSTSTRNVKNKRTGKTKQVQVDSFFRLPSSSKKTGKTHSLRCRYNGDPVLEKQVAMSQEIKKLGEDIEPLLVGGGKKVAEYRLHILMEIIRASYTKFKSENDGDGDDGDDKFSGYRYVRSQKHLKPFIKSAKAILSFISRIGDKNELSRMIALRYGESSISWNDFLFKNDEHEALYRYLVEHKQFAYAPGRNRPVAVVLKLKQTPAKETQFGDLQIEAVSTECSDGERTFLIRPMIFIEDHSLMNAIRKHKHILVCAVPTTEMLNEPANPKYRPSVRIKMKVIDRHQFCAFPMQR